jgi:hypothetical protein
MLTCYECAKLIRGKAKITRPHYLLKNDFARAYHEECYELSELKAAKELGIQP